MDTRIKLCSGRTQHLPGCEEGTELPKNAILGQLYELITPAHHGRRLYYYTRDGWHFSGREDDDMDQSNINNVHARPPFRLTRFYTPSQVKCLIERLIVESGGINPMSKEFKVILFKALDAGETG